MKDNYVINRKKKDCEYIPIKLGIDADDTIFGCDSLLYNFANNLSFHTPGDKLKFREIHPNDEAKKTLGLLKVIKFFNPAHYVEKYDAIKYINLLHSEGKQNNIITDRPDISPFSSSLHSWLNDNNVKFDGIYIGCSDKVALAKKLGIDIMIDNKIETCEKMYDEGIYVIHYVDPTKKIKPSHDIQAGLYNTVYSWQEVYETIKSLEPKIMARRQAEMESSKKRKLTLFKPEEKEM